MKYLLLLALLTTAGLAQAEIYRWVDKNGHVHFGDQPPTDVDAEQRHYTNNMVNSDASNYEANKAAKGAPVVLYTTPNCKELCDQARDLLKKRKIPYSEQSIASKEQLDSASKSLGVNQLSFPSMTVGKQLNSGFSDAGWQAALDTVGYPKAP